MAKKVTLKTRKNASSVTAYVDSIGDDALRRDARALLKLFRRVTGVRPRMWGDSIVGYGEYTYHRANGDEGEFMATGFSIRKSGPVIYIMPGYQDFSAILTGLGKHRLGKSCLYLKRLDDVDTDVLERLIATGLEQLQQSHDVRMR